VIVIQVRMISRDVATAVLVLLFTVLRPHTHTHTRPVHYVPNVGGIWSFYPKCFSPGCGYLSVKS